MKLLVQDPPGSGHPLHISRADQSPIAHRIAVRDFALRFRPALGERAQVALGRMAIVVAMFLGIGAAGIIAWLALRRRRGRDTA